MSLDGFIAGPGDAMNWIFDFVAPDAAWLTETAAATGAMLIGRRTDEVGSRMEAGEERGTASRGEGYPFSGPMFVLTHEPPDRRTRRSRTSPVTSGKRSPRHWTLRAGRTSKSSALTWPVSACGEDSWTRSWCMSCRCCSATASGSTPPPVSRGSTWNRSTARGRKPSPSFASASASSHRCSTAARRALRDRKS